MPDSQGVRHYLSDMLHENSFSWYRMMIPSGLIQKTAPNLCKGFKSVLVGWKKTEYSRFLPIISTLPHKHVKEMAFNP